MVLFGEDSRSWYGGSHRGTACPGGVWTPVTTADPYKPTLEPLHNVASTICLLSAQENSSLCPMSWHDC